MPTDNMNVRVGPLSVQTVENLSDPTSKGNLEYYLADRELYFTRSTVPQPFVFRGALGHLDLLYWNAKAGTIEGTTTVGKSGYLLFNSVGFDFSNQPIERSIFTGAGQLLYADISGNVSVLNPGPSGSYLVMNNRIPSWDIPEKTTININGQTSNTQQIVIENSGKDISILSENNTHTIKVPSASADNRGLLKKEDWTKFNSKQDFITPSQPDYFFSGTKEFTPITSDKIKESGNLYFTKERTITAIGGKAGNGANDLWTGNTINQWSGSTNINTVGSITSGIWFGTPINVVHGGTGANSAEDARINLGLEINKDVQKWNKNLDQLSNSLLPSTDLVGVSDAQILSNKTLYNCTFSNTIIYGSQGGTGLATLVPYGILYATSDKTFGFITPRSGNGLVLKNTKNGPNFDYINSADLPSHSHTMLDLSGCLSVEQGGTGSSNFNYGLLIVDKNTFKTIDAPMGAVLTKTTNGWEGIIPKAVSPAITTTVPAGDEGAIQINHQGRLGAAGKFHGNMLSIPHDLNVESGILKTDSNACIQMNNDGSSDTWLQVNTGNQLELTAISSNENADLHLIPKGTGKVIIHGDWDAPLKQADRNEEVGLLAATLCPTDLDGASILRSEYSNGIAVYRAKFSGNKKANWTVFTPYGWDGKTVQLKLFWTGDTASNSTVEIKSLKYTINPIGKWSAVSNATLKVVQNQNVITQLSTAPTGEGNDIVCIHVNVVSDGEVYLLGGKAIFTCVS